MASSEKLCNEKGAMGGIARGESAAHPSAVVAAKTTTSAQMRLLGRQEFKTGFHVRIAKRLPAHAVAPLIFGRWGDRSQFACWLATLLFRRYDPRLRASAALYQRGSSPARQLLVGVRNDLSKMLNQLLCIVGLKSVLIFSHRCIVTLAKNIVDFPPCGLRARLAVDK
jgi:hypothetical protein